MTKVIFFRISVSAAALLQNVALLKGQILTKRCSMHFAMLFNSWYFIPVGTPIEKIIYDEKGLNGEYVRRAEVDNSSLKLTISSIQLDDAGIYGCKTIHNSAVITENAQVIVIGELYSRKLLSVS